MDTNLIRGVIPIAVFGVILIVLTISFFEERKDQEAMVQRRIKYLDKFIAGQRNGDVPMPIRPSSVLVGGWWCFYFNPDNDKRVIDIITKYKG